MLTHLTHTPSSSSSCSSYAHLLGLFLPLHHATHARTAYAHSHTHTHLTPGPRCVVVDVVDVDVDDPADQGPSPLSRLLPSVPMPDYRIHCLALFLPRMPLSSSGLSHHAIPSLQEDLPPSPNSSYEGRVPVLRELSCLTSRTLLACQLSIHPSQRLFNKASIPAEPLVDFSIA